MKMIPRILSTIIVVGLLAAIPASTQGMYGSEAESSTRDNTLPMLILINRLELSPEQIQSLRDILSGLLAQRDTMDASLSEFEDVMIEFQGTSEELDELLAAFREDRQTAAEAIRDSIVASLDEVRDLLTINQGMVLREALPGLLGGGPAAQGQRGRMMQGMRGTQPGALRMSDRIGAANVEPMSGLRQGQMKADTASRPGALAGRAGMVAQRLGQIAEEDTAGTLLEELQSRVEQLEDQAPPGLLERLEQLSDRSQSLGGTTCPMNIRNGAASQGTLRAGGHGRLFDFLEEIMTVLDLKLAALN